MNGSGEIRTHVIEMTGALNQRLRPFGHTNFLGEAYARWLFYCSNITEKLS